MPRRPVHQVPSVADVQGGAFTRAQALDEGWSGGSVTRRLRSGHWRRVCGEGLCGAGRARSPDTYAWAAHLTWPFAVVSHLTAAGLHGFPVTPSDEAHVTVDNARGAVRGAVVHRARLEPEDVVRRESRPAVTTRRRTALDCLRLLAFDEALQLTAWLFTRRVLDHADLVVEVGGTPRRWGTPQLRRLLEVTEGGALSIGENRLHALLREARVGGWEANAVVDLDGQAVAVVDVCFRDAKVVIEVDGFAAHTGPHAFVMDRRRQNGLVGRGWMVLRYTWRDLVERPAQVIAEIRRIVRSRSVEAVS